jgi:hypothetical protein
MECPTQPTLLLELELEAATAPGSALQLTISMLGLARFALPPLALLDSTGQPALLDLFQTRLALLAPMEWPTRPTLLQEVV